MWACWDGGFWDPRSPKWPGELHSCFHGHSAHALLDPSETLVNLNNAMYFSISKGIYLPLGRPLSHWEYSFTINLWPFDWGLPLKGSQPHTFGMLLLPGLGLVWPHKESYQLSDLSEKKTLKSFSYGSFTPTDSNGCAACQVPKPKHQGGGMAGGNLPPLLVSTAKLTSLESCTLLVVLLCPHSYLVSLYLLRYECYCEREQRCLSCSRFMALHSNDSLLLPFSPIHKVPLQRL